MLRRRATAARSSKNTRQRHRRVCAARATSRGFPSWLPPCRVFTVGGRSAVLSAPRVGDFAGAV